MGENSKIEWCDHTFNPWIGCQKVSPGCDFCYAETQNNFRKWNGGEWGPHAPRKRTSPGNWKKPLLWALEARATGTRPRVFCASLADVFDNQAPDGARDDLWSLIRATPELDWLLLTKRPENIAKMLPADWGDGYPNVWLGTTVEDQANADRRIPILCKVPARLRFLSCEPLLGPVNLTRCGQHYTGSGPLHLWKTDLDGNDGWRKQFSEPAPEIHWVISGGESGGQARQSHHEWHQSLRDQCAAAGVPFLFKQWGEWFSETRIGVDVDLRCLTPGQAVTFGDGKTNHTLYTRLGKKKAGRLLDGIEHNGFPAAPVSA